MSILKKIAWNFNDTDYQTSDDFNKDISQYQLDIMKERASWNPDEIVVNNPEVGIVYMYWVSEGDPVFDGETKLGDEDEEDDEEEEYDEDEQREVAAKFKADNGKHFTALELLHKLHQRLRHRNLGDHTFFEGLSFFNDSEKRNPPVYYLRCGS
ncbi:MAG: hypothetical protein FD123_4187 [Bacteroidetes bacterium]|nr:MAG: hypothetical protein FD123_4187 [Bacteroidota bacterium]